MIALDLLWWVGAAWFVAWTALPLLLWPALGPFLGAVVWALLAPWTALLGMVMVHRLLPASPRGIFRPFADRGSVRWALKGWAPSVFLTVFQPMCFMSQGFQRLALRGFEARMGRGAQVTSRTILREPHHLALGAGAVVGEFVHLICSYQPRPGLLLVGDITIGAGTLVGAHSAVGPGVQLGDNCVVGHAVSLGAHCTVGAGTRIGAGTAIYNSARIGAGVRIGKRCFIGSGIQVADGTRIPDGTIVRGGD